VNPRPVVVLLALVATLLAMLLPTASVASGQARAGSTDVVLADLPAGAEPSSLYAADNVIHDGALKVPVALARRARVIGRTPGGYVVMTGSASGFHGKLYRVDAGTGDVVGIGRNADLQRPPRLLRGGRFLAYADGSEKARVTVRDTTTGQVVAKRRLGGDFGSMIDAAGSRVLAGSERPNLAVYWNPFHDRVRVVRTGFVLQWGGDVRHGLIALLPAPHEDDVCPVLIRSDHPHRELWTGCRRSPVAFSPDGATMLVTRFEDIGDSGLLRVEVRRTEDGGLLHVYRAQDIDPVYWEDDEHFLMVLHPAGASGAVRCDLAGACERASAVVPESQHESYALGWTFPEDARGFGLDDEGFLDEPVDRAR
jgi:hypothetical protein